MQRFQEFKALVENQAGRKIRVLRSDNEGEYTSRELDGYCRHEGIRRQLTVAYTPEQKGRTDLLLAQLELCYMTSDFLSSFGQRHAVQLFIFRTGVPIVPWGT